MTDLQTLRQKAAEGRPITMVTAYDYSMARLVDRSDVDMILVGDSLALAMLGYESTDRVTLDEMVHHTAAVTRGVEDTVVVADLPFGSYNTGDADAVRSANRLKKEGGADAVKLEGGREIAKTVDALDAAGIPAVGHIGVTPQTEAVGSGASMYRGNTAAEADAVVEEAVAIDEAGAPGLVLELVTRETAGAVTDAVDGFTLGIGAGPHCDGQVVTNHDLLGTGDLLPSTVAGFQADVGADIIDHLNEFHDATGDGRFPTAESSASMPDDQAGAFDRS